MQETTAASAVALIRDNRSRILAGLATAALIAIALFGGRSWALVLALGPAIVGAVVATIQSAKVDGWVDSRDRQFQRVSAWADSKSGKFARYFARPAGAGSRWLWANTQSIHNPSTRSGVRVSVALYFWAVMTALLAAVAYVVLAVLVLVLIIGLVSWLMSLGSSSSSDSSSTYSSRSHRTEDEVLSAAGRGGQTIHRKDGLFSESETGRVDANGRIYKKTGIFSEDEVARIDESGHVHEKTGMFSEEERHRLDAEGRIFKKTGMFSEEEVGRVAPDGRIYKKTGMFSEEEIGRVEDA